MAQPLSAKRSFSPGGPTTCIAIGTNVFVDWTPRSTSLRRNVATDLGTRCQRLDAGHDKDVFKPQSSRARDREQSGAEEASPTFQAK